MSGCSSVATNQPNDAAMRIRILVSALLVGASLPVMGQVAQQSLANACAAETREAVDIETDNHTANASVFQKNRSQIIEFYQAREHKYVAQSCADTIRYTGPNENDALKEIASFTQLMGAFDRNNVRGARASIAYFKLEICLGRARLTQCIGRQDLVKPRRAYQ